ncbi:hypothetical protein [Streptomyces spinosirectus]
MRTHVLRPGHIRPRNGARASSSAAQAFHTVTGPLFPVLRRAYPDWATSTEAIGRAVVVLSRTGSTYPSILTSRDIDRLAGMCPARLPAERSRGPAPASRLTTRMTTVRYSYSYD